MADSSVFNVTSRLEDFEPFHFTKSLGCSGYGILNGIFYAFLRRPNQFENFVNMIFHLNILQVGRFRLL